MTTVTLKGVGDKNITFDIEEVDGSGAVVLLDESLGQKHNDRCLIDTAMWYGMKPYKSEWDYDDLQDEELAELVRSAENYLNERVDEGWSFGWHEGNFVLANEKWWEKAS